MTNTELHTLFKRAAEEKAQSPNFTLPVQLSLDCALALAGALRIALKSPKLTPSEADASRQFIEGACQSLFNAGYVAHAELVAMANGDTEFAVVWRRA